MKKKIIFFLLVCFLFLFFCGVYFLNCHETSIQSKENVIDSSILSITIDGISTEKIPLKTSNLKVKKILCNDNVSPFWDYNVWGLKLRNLTKSNLKCSVDFTKEYSETLLNGANPVLKDNLIPVTIETDGVVKKANLGTEWYNYGEKIWANAVILFDKTKNYYDGEIIPESEIESYFVWIPRYKYKIFNEGNYQSLSEEVSRNTKQTIDIVFENKATPLSNGSKVGEFLTHPAFRAFQTDGLWVGKYTVSHEGDTIFDEKNKNVVDIDKINIKPNQYFWAGIAQGNMYLNSYNYQRIFDSHMMKNTEWGSIAYLSQSIYGINDYVGWNNNINNVSGYVANFKPTCSNPINSLCNQNEAVEPLQIGEFTNPYSETLSAKGTTSGNISGIYDMSGGIWQYTMSLMKTSDGDFYAGLNDDYPSLFNGIYTCPTCLNGSGVLNKTDGIPIPNAKYYDEYQYNVDPNNFSNRILGDATGELGPFFKKPNGLGTSGWFLEASYFLNTDGSVFLRGGESGGGSWSGSDFGIMSFSTDWRSGSLGNFGYRIVLAF